MPETRGSFIAQGQLPIASTALWTAPAENSTWRIHLIVLHNTDGNARLSTIRIRKGTNTARILDSTSIAASNTRELSYPGCPVILHGGDSIWGVAAAANVVDYLIFGEIEEE